MRENIKQAIAALQNAQHALGTSDSKAAVKFLQSAQDEIGRALANHVGPNDTTGTNRLDDESP